MVKWHKDDSIHIRLPSGLKQELQDLADIYDSSLSWVVVRALTKYVQSVNGAKNNVD